MAGGMLSGRLATGIGMGKTFTRLDWARTQFVEKPGIDPFPGTINVILGSERNGRTRSDEGL